MTDLPQTPLEAVRYFADLDICHFGVKELWHCLGDSA